jgi:hypothetical protein
MRNFFHVSLSRTSIFFPLFTLVARPQAARVNDIVRDFGTWKILFSITECAENRTNQAEERPREASGRKQLRASLWRRWQKRERKGMSV